MPLPVAIRGCHLPYESDGDMGSSSTRENDLGRLSRNVGSTVKPDSRLALVVLYGLNAITRTVLCFPYFSGSFDSFAESAL